jgi:MATE family multidrug resistance protein
MVFQTFRCYSDGKSKTLPPMIAMIAGNILNVLLNYMFIFGNFGAPAMGVEGAAIGTLISRIVMSVILLFLLYYWKGLWGHIKDTNFFVYRKNMFKKILNLGVPTSLQMFFEVSAFAGAALIIGNLGAVPQAAHQIAINLASISFMICTGIAMASTIRVGNQLGQNNSIGVSRAGLSAIIQVTLFMSFTALIFVFCRRILPELYIDDPQVVAIAASLLIVTAIFQISDGVQVVGLGILRGLQDVKVPTLITFVSYWLVGIPFSYLAAFHWEWGPVGVWIGLVLGLTLSASLLTLRFYLKTKSL